MLKYNLLVVNTLWAWQLQQHHCHNLLQIPLTSFCCSLCYKQFMSLSQDLCPVLSPICHSQVFHLTLDLFHCRYNFYMFFSRCTFDPQVLPVTFAVQCNRIYFEARTFENNQPTHSTFSIFCRDHWNKPFSLNLWYWPEVQGIVWWYVL
jgi:hypothetical protein